MSAEAGPAASPQSQTSSPFGVVDIGSNSIRLVIFERLSRNPWPLFNEKVVCGIARGMVSSGELHKEGTVRALEALGRFRTLADGMNVPGLQVVATAAVRDAANGAAFAKKAEKAVGAKIRVLTGAEEARLAAHGVLFGIPDADGLVGDLGGGSLELMEVRDGKLGEGATLPLGPLRLMDAAKGKIKSAQEIIEDELHKAEWLGGLKGRTLYLVGGTWRNFTSIAMEQENHPLRILQNYAAPAGKAKSLAALLKPMSARSLRQVGELSTRRLEAMPFGAAVLERLIKVSKVATVVTSVYGVREGVLFEAIDEAERGTDPLLAAAADLNVQLARSPGHAPELNRWLAPLFDRWPDDLKRFQQVVSFLSDIGWRYHPDYRAERAFERVLTMPVAGLTHQARAFLALAMAARYGAGISQAPFKPARRLLELDIAQKAEAAGLALRLAYQISGAVAGLLPHSALKIGNKSLVLTFDRSQGPLAGEIVQKRLQNLASVLGLEARIEFD